METIVNKNNKMDSLITQPNSDITANKTIKCAKVLHMVGGGPGALWVWQVSSTGQVTSRFVYSR